MLQRPDTNIDEVLPSLLFALFSGFSHLFLFLSLWYGPFTLLDLFLYQVESLVFLLKYWLYNFFRFFIFGSVYCCSIYAAPHSVLLEPFRGNDYCICLQVLSFFFFQYIYELAFSGSLLACYCISWKLLNLFFFVDCFHCMWYRLQLYRYWKMSRACFYSWFLNCLWLTDMFYCIFTWSHYIWILLLQWPLVI